MRASSRLFGRRTVVCSILLRSRRGGRRQSTRVLLGPHINALGRFDATGFRAHEWSIALQNAEKQNKASSTFGCAIVA